MDARPPRRDPDQMAADLKAATSSSRNMAVVLRGLMAAFQDRPGIGPRRSLRSPVICAPGAKQP